MKRVSPFRAGANSLLASLAILLCSSGLGLAQDIATKGGISGRVTDSAGAAIANAKVTITGQAGDRTVTANAGGEFEIQNLIPGSYKVKVEQSGFKTLNVPGVEVYVGKTSALKLALETGNISEVVEVTAGAAAVDTTSTAIGSNLNDQLYQNIPLARSVQSLFYLAPGATDGLGGGQANPSISGGSALDNLYIADGVNITDSAFGGLGVFTRSYGSLGTAINTTYVKEVQVKTGGFEPQFGQAQGGIINIITKSGTNQYHGEVFGFFQPQGFERERLFVDDVVSNRAGKLLHPENYDAGFEFSGPAPGLKDRVFFFGSFNPTVRRDIVRGAEGSGLRTIYGDGTHRHTYTKNYAVKVDTNLSSKHQFNFSIFGDPTTTNVAPFRTLNIDNTTANSRLDYGTRNLAVRYNGTLSPTWTISSSFSFGKNTFSESGFANFSQITDLTQLQDPVINPTGRGQFTPIGLGFFEPTESRTYRGTVDTSKRATIWGEHTFAVGYQYQRAFYDGLRDRSGPKYTIPATNADGTLTIPAGVAGQPLNAQFRLRLAGASCTLCPLMLIPGNTQSIGFGTGVQRVFLQQFRGEFGNPVFDTQSNYHAAYAQDTWRLNRFITALIGYRWEQERVIGAILPESGKRNAYSFTGQWSPRLGVTVDPFGKGKTKVYYNFGRFHEFLPLDAAERSLSSEKDFTGGRFAPDFTVIGGNRRVVINRFGTVNPIIDAAHLLSGAAGGTGGPPTISAQDVSNPIIPGTKLGYTNEHLVGFEQQLPGKWFFSVRYIDRRIGRIIEDAASVSPEAANAGIGQTYFIGNVSKNLDASINLVPFPYTTGSAAPAGCARDGGALLFNFDGAGNRSVCFAQTGVDALGASIVRSDGKSDGFPNPVRNYKAVEIELNKRFSSGWQLMSNWRIAKLVGNFEGHLRNDNGQTDPGISSLFDFTTGDLNLLGDQFAAGILNTDRRHIVNLYGSYEFGEQYSKLRILKGLNAGTNIRFQSGIPVSEYLAHPVYLNAGEIPVGGRGKLGRTPFYGQMDLHFDYRWSLTETWKLRYEVNFFNVTNNRDVRLINQFRELQADVPNGDFRLPASYYAPFRVHMGLKLSF
jgi:Carboxypeptidase regulatory-like domain